MEKQDSGLKGVVEKGAKNFEAYLNRKLNDEADIIDVLKQDHRPIKECIRTMLDEEKNLEEQVRAFTEFVPLLVTHALAEERTFYETMKTNVELRHHAYEGEAEHSIADQLCEEIKRADREDEIRAKIKLVAEMVEHHIDEEESEVFPEAKEKLNKATRMSLRDAYVKEQEQIIAQGQTDSPSEAADIQAQKH